MDPLEKHLREMKTPALNVPEFREELKIKILSSRQKSWKKEFALMSAVATIMAFLNLVQLYQGEKKHSRQNASEMKASNTSETEVEIKSSEAESQKNDIKEIARQEIPNQDENINYRREENKLVTAILDKLENKILNERNLQ